MQLTWKPSVLSSALHAAEMVASGRSLLNKPLHEALADIVPVFYEIASNCLIGSERFWDWLIGLSCEYENSIQLAERVMAKAYSGNDRSSEFVTRLATHIALAENALLESAPKAKEELPLRIRPLQELWESYGAGLLIEIGRLSDPTFLVKEALVVPVLPVVGGTGGVLLQSNRVWIEAVLTNPNPTLPEVVRLAWLLSQLEADLPIHGELVNSGRLSWIASLAMLPPTLLAAENMDIGSYSDDQLLLAIEKWHIPNPTDHSLVDTLKSWWATFSQERPPWRIALTALDKMLS